MSPKYNKASVYDEPTTFEITDLNFKKFELIEFINANNPKPYSVSLKIDSYTIGEKRIRKGFWGANFTSRMELDTKTKVDLYIDKCMMDEYFCKYFIY